MQSTNKIEWAHSHNFSGTFNKNAKKVKMVFLITFIVMLLEISAGVWTGSMALLADGWHMGTHAAAFLIAMYAYWYAKKHAKNRQFSFGTGKVNSLGGRKRILSVYDSAVSAVY